ncbi:MAG: SPOR domain-containing protein [Pseudomonadota bacterium]
MSDSSQTKYDAVAQDDPFAELLRLTEEANPEDNEAVADSFPEENQSVEPAVPEEPVAAVVDMPADLEQALLAELGVEQETTPEPGSPVAEVFDEGPDAVADPVDFDATFEEGPTLEELLGEELEPAVPVEEVVEPVKPSLEDELAALLGDSGGDDAVAPFEPVDVDGPPVVAQTLSEQEARMLMETALADDGVVDPQGVQPEVYYIEETEMAPEAQVDLEDAIAAELEQSPVAFEEPVPAPVDEVAEPASVEDDLDIDALFEDALANESIFEDGSETNPVAAEPVAEADPLDELLGIMGDTDSDPLATASSEEEFSISPETPAFAPTLETQEISLEDDLDLSDFDMPQSNEGVSPGAESGIEQTLEDTLSVAALASGQTTDGQVPDFAVDDAFDEMRFEAELARDMEFAAHDAQIRSGDELDNFSAELETELEMPELEGAPVEKNQRGLKIAAIVGSIAIAGALGLFLLGGGSDTETAGPVVVEADPEPIKVRPEQPGGTEVPNQDSAVFAGNDSAEAPTQPSLVATSQEPVDLAGLPSVEQAKGEDRLVPDATSDAGSGDAISAEDGAIAPRRVRTLIVRPDGTLEERPIEETSLNVAALEPAEPVVPVTPTDGLSGQAVEAPVAEVPIVEAAPAEGEQAITPQPAAAEPVVSSSEVPVRRVQTQVISPNPIPDRPVEQPLNIVGEAPQQQQVAAVQPTTSATDASAVPAAEPASPFKVQIASLPSQAAAQQTSANLLSRFRNVLGGRGVAIRAAEVPNRGTFYRVQVDAASLDDANGLCSRYKAAGGDCIVTR